MEERILKIAEHLFLKLGIRSVTLDDISKELGISKKTIYQFFKDKDDLVEKVTKTSLEREEKRSVAYLSQSKNAIEEIFLSMDSMKEMFGTINSVLFFDLKKYHPKAYEFYENFKKFELAQITKNLERGISENIYRKNIHVELLAKFRIEAIDLVFNHEIFSPNKFNIFDSQMEILENFLRGIVTEKGQEILMENLKENKIQNEI